MRNAIMDTPSAVEAQEEEIVSVEVRTFEVLEIYKGHRKLKWVAGEVNSRVTSDEK